MLGLLGMIAGSGKPENLLLVGFLGIPEHQPLKTYVLLSMS
jgi:hypothetical protein